MSKLLRVAFEVQKILESTGKPFCIIGALAVQRWGEPRVTRDVDVTIFTAYRQEDEIIDLISSAIEPRISEHKNFAIVNRVLLLKKGEVDIDISLGGLPFEEQMMTRATKFNYSSEISLTTCSAEDLIVLKCFADREKDWGDVEGILVRQKSRNLNIEHIKHWLTILQELKDDDTLITKFHKKLEKIQRL